jgi:hypothetical protein
LMASMAAFDAFVAAHRQGEIHVLRDAGGDQFLGPKRLRRRAA